MKTSGKLWIGMTVGFVLGCGFGLGAGVGASNLVIPPARAGSNPQKWEYFCDDYARHLASVKVDEVTKHVNQLGAEGWEMAQAYAGSLCYKRPLP